MKYTLTINSVTDKVKELLSQIEENEEMELESSDFWEDLNKNEQNEINEAISELDDGKRISYTDFLKKNSL